MKCLFPAYVGAFMAFCMLTNLFGQDYALKQLNDSPRHHEWVSIPTDTRPVEAFVAYPETAEKALAVVVIHENRGLNDWARSFADQLAAKGYIAVAPDLLTGKAPGGGNTKDFASSDEARKAIYQLKAKQVMKDLKASVAYAQKLSAANGKVVSAGFCWGGSKSMQLAFHDTMMLAAMVFYGRGPKDLSKVNKIKLPVYGFYGGNDQRINAGIPLLDSVMRVRDNVYEYSIYDGAGHAFMRRGDNPKGGEANVRARNAAWERMLAILEDL